MVGWYMLRTPYGHQHQTRSSLGARHHVHVYALRFLCFIVYIVENSKLETLLIIECRAESKQKKESSTIRTQSFAQHGLPMFRTTSIKRVFKPTDERCATARIRSVCKFIMQTQLSSS